jgi:hypothetical protein
MRHDSGTDKESARLTGYIDFGRFGVRLDQLAGIRTTDIPNPDLFMPNSN